MRHILIGGAGFLGQEVARKLVTQLESTSSQDSLVVIDANTQALDPTIVETPYVSVITADIAIPGVLDSVPLAENDVVHHMASRLITPNRPRFGRYDYFARTSVTGTKNVLAWMNVNQCKSLVFWSTDMVYGNAHASPVSETNVPQPLGPYGATKVMAEHLVVSAMRDNGLQCSIFRPRLIIGPNRLGILEKLFKAARANRPIPMIGSGNNRFQFVSVEDCARASILAAQKGCPNGIFNLGSANPPTIKTLLQGLITAAGSKSILIATPACAVKAILELLNLLTLSPMDQEQFRIADKDTTVDCQRAKQILGWQPEHNDLDMLIAAYKSYEAKL